MRTVITSFWIVPCILIVSLSRCGQTVPDNNSNLSRQDTLNILQTVFNDISFKQDASYFPNQSIKLVSNKIIHQDYRVFFNKQPIKIVSIKEEGREIGTTYPKQFFVGITMLKAINKNTVLLSLLIYAGSATVSYKINRNESSWKVISIERGKF